MASQLSIGHGIAVMAGIFIVLEIIIIANGIVPPSIFTTGLWILTVVVVILLLALYIKWVLEPIREKRRITGPESLVGQKGVAITDLSPAGEIRVQGILWGAEAESSSIKMGKRVIVRFVRGLTLVVEEEDQTQKAD
jgi:membrane-bound serine protease (ClpP class)